MSNDSGISSDNNDTLAANASPVIGSPSTLNPMMNLNTLLTKKKYIDLSYQGLNDTNINILIDVLNTNSTCLKQLNLYGNRLTFTNSQLAIALGACTSLTVLSLGDNNIGPDGAANIANHIIAVTTSLVELHLGDNHIADIGTTSIAKALCTNDTIQLLGLYDNQIGDIGAVSLANTTISTAPTGTIGSTTNTTNTTVLREIWLHNNHIGNVGGKAILEALRTSSNSTDAAVVKNGSVENMFLMNNKISSDINTDICKVLADRKKKMMTSATTAPVILAEEVVVVEETTMKKEKEELSAADAAALPLPTSPTSGALFHSTTTSNSNAPVPPSSPTAKQVAVIVREALTRDVLNTLKSKDLEITKLSTALELERERSCGKDVEIAALKARVMEMTAEPVAAVDAVTSPPVLLSSSASFLMNDELPFIVGNASLKDTSTVGAVADSSHPEEEDARDETEENSNNDTLHITVSVE